MQVLIDSMQDLTMPKSPCLLTWEVLPSRLIVPVGVTVAGRSHNFLYDSFDDGLIIPVPCVVNLRSSSLGMGKSDWHECRRVAAKQESALPGNAKLN
jgi:hypothetical protein